MKNVGMGNEMSHKVVYMGISGNELKGDISLKKVSSYVKKTMKEYVEETAKEKNVKCDWYVIGGRWEGAIGAIKGAKNVVLTENGLFPYKFFDQYDAIINAGHRGPYFVDDVEYIPVNAGLKKDIAWDSISRLAQYKTFRFLELILNKDSCLGDGLVEGYEIKDGNLYVGKNKSLILKNNETFSEWAERLGVQFGRVMMSPDAYIDVKGVWHDENDAWAKCEKEIMSGKFRDIPENLEEAVQKAYLENYEKFMNEELKDDDCFVILDCHCFP